MGFRPIHTSRELTQNHTHTSTGTGFHVETGGVSRSGIAGKGNEGAYCGTHTHMPAHTHMPTHTNSLAHGADRGTDLTVVCSGTHTSTHTSTGTHRGTDTRFGGFLSLEKPESLKSEREVSPIAPNTQTLQTHILYIFINSLVRNVER